jgi:hypothetical protein
MKKWERLKGVYKVTWRSPVLNTRLMGLELKSIYSPEYEEEGEEEDVEEELKMGLLCIRN